MIETIVIIIVFLFFSALFSASETALLSLDSVKIKRIQKHNRDVRFITLLLSNPSRFLTTILIGNTLVDITITTLLSSFCMRIFGEGGLALSIGIATFLVLIFGEVVPKTFAIKKAEELSPSIARFLHVFGKLIYPLSRIFTATSNAVIALWGIPFIKEPTLTQEELKSVIELSHREGLVKENEKEMIRSVLELTQTTVQEIMTPRPDIKAISLDRTQQEVLRQIQTVKNSKLPVYKETIDNIAGFLYVKDFFFSPERDFKTLIKPAMFVPATRKIADLLKDFQAQNIKIAVVIDEYGNTYGLVTLEDILEEIIGEIYDEYDTKENFIETIDSTHFRISGKTSIDYVNKALHLGIPYGDYETIAGYMLFLFEKIPHEGERVKKEPFSFHIEKMAGKRIKSILLEKP